MAIFFVYYFLRKACQKCQLPSPKPYLRPRKLLYSPRPCSVQPNTWG